MQKTQALSSRPVARGSQEVASPQNAQLRHRGALKRTLADRQQSLRSGQARQGFESSEVILERSPA